MEIENNISITTPDSVRNEKVDEAEIDAMFAELNEDEGSEEGEDSDESWMDDELSGKNEEDDNGETDEGDSDDSEDPDDVEASSDDSYDFNEDSALKADKKGYYLVRDAKGQLLKVPQESTILKRINGEWKEFTTKNLVNKSISEVSYEQRVSELNNKVKFADDVSDVFKKVDESLKAGDIRGIANVLADIQGRPPGTILKELFSSTFRTQKDIAEKIGIDPETGKVPKGAGDAFFSNLDKEYFEGKTKQQDEVKKAEVNKQEWEQNAQKILNQYEITGEIFTKATTFVKDQGFRSEATDVDGRFNEIFNVALELKKGVQVKAVLDKMNINYWKDQEIRSQLLDIVDPVRHNVDKIKQLANTIINGVKSDLSKKISKNTVVKASKVSQPKQRDTSNKLKKITSIDQLRSVMGS